VLILSHCSGNSIRGITLKRRGKVSRIYVRPDLDRDITLYDGENPLFILILDRKEVGKVELHYIAEERKWTIKRRSEKETGSTTK